MLKKYFHLKEPQTYRYLDSINAAIINGFAHHGIDSKKTTGPHAHPWTFACQGYALPGGKMILKGLTISTPDQELASALDKMQGRDICAEPSTGDMITLFGAKGKNLSIDIHPDQNEICVNFASPFLVSRVAPYDKNTPEFLADIRCVDISNRLKRSADRAANRTLDISFCVDRLTLAAHATPRWVSFRKAGSKRIMLPAFKFPLTIRGSAKDISHVMHAGIGSKTRQGFGLPLILS